MALNLSESLVELFLQTEVIMFHAKLSTARLPFWLRHAWHVCLVVAMLASLACSQRGSGTIPRPDPGHTNRLVKQSMLGNAQEMSRIVSGSELGWRTSATAGSAEAGLERGNIWLQIQPQTLLTSGGQDVFEELASSSALENLVRLGISGLFIAPSNEAAGQWVTDRRAGRAWDDIISHNFAEYVGTEEHFIELRSLAASKKIRLGGELVPAATGIGPDFHLATQALRDYAGAYVLIEVPTQLWSKLPASEGDNSFKRLTPAQLAPLAEQGIVPASLVQDQLLWAQPGGWAVTGTIKGHDGVMRRWVYRYSGSPERPVLSWDDPSAAARRLVSAGIIRQVGILHQTMVGVRTEPFFGLAPNRVDKTASKLNLEPGPSALMAISREIQRYGASAVEREWLPAEQMAQFQLAGADFVMDGITSPAAEEALLTGDASRLRENFDAASRFNVEQARVSRVISNNDGLAMNAKLIPETWRKVIPVEQNRVFASAPALAAMRAGLSPEMLKEKKNQAEILRLHTLLLALRASLPGMLWVSGHDLTGVTLPEIMNTASAYSNILPAWSLGASPAAATRQGLGRGLAVYGSFPVQESLGDSFAAKLKRFAAIRDKFDIANGHSVRRLPTRGQGSIVLLSSLPKGGFLLTAVNFSDTYASERVDLPAGTSRALLDIWAQSPISIEGNSFALGLPALSFRIIHIPAR